MKILMDVCVVIIGIIAVFLVVCLVTKSEERGKGKNGSIR